MMKLTRWHSKNVTPVRKGVYMVDKNDSAYAYWDGNKFCFRRFDYIDNNKKQAIKRAYECRDWDSGLPKRTEWRGLAEKPK